MFERVTDWTDNNTFLKRTQTCQTSSGCGHFSVWSITAGLTSGLHKVDVSLQSTSKAANMVQMCHSWQFGSIMADMRKRCGLLEAEIRSGLQECWQGDGDESVTVSWMWELVEVSEPHYLTWLVERSTLTSHCFYKITIEWINKSTAPFYLRHFQHLGPCPVL